MFSLYGDRPLKVDDEPLRQLAEHPSVEVNSEWSWVEARRYSNRQRRHIIMGGVVGGLTIGGPESVVSQIGAWLDLATVLRVGKATSFGFGALSLWEPPRP